jgi:multidrug transporter EmrE-like cation transporter
MKTTLTSWLWLTASIASYSAGEYFSKKIAGEFRWSYFWMILLCYAGSGLFWIPAMMQRNSLIVLGFTWSLLSIISTLAIGFSMGETFSTTQIVGIVMAVASIIILSF